MTEGLLWFSNDPKRDIADKVAAAADRYQFKFDRRPNLCYVHTSMLDTGSVELNGVRLVGAGNVTKNYFWIGVEQEALGEVA